MPGAADREMDASTLATFSICDVSGRVGSVEEVEVGLVADHDRLFFAPGRVFRVLNRNFRHGRLFMGVCDLF